MNGALESGRVAVLKSWKGAQYTLRRMGVGACFGEMALIDFGPRSASVLADEDCTAIELSSSDLRAVYKRDLKQYALIYMNMGRELGRRLREADERLFRAKIETGAVTEGYAFQS